MFKKIVSNLPFNPSMITALGFYSDRLKKEKSLRRLSFVFIAMTMVVQMVVVASPPQRSLAASSNHILNGLSKNSSTTYNKNYLLKSWDNNADVRAIYSYFGVTRADLSGMVADKIFSQKADYWTTGRNSLSGYSKVSQQYKNSQMTIEYAAGKKVYMRQLRAWDIVNQNGNYYSGLKGTIKATGETFWILYDCGNFTKVGKYIPPPPPPPPPPPVPEKCKLDPNLLKNDPKCKKKCEYNTNLFFDDPKCVPPPPPPPPKPILDIKKSIIDKPAYYNPGDSYTYLVQYRNTVNASVAEDVSISDELDTKNFTVVSVLPAEATVNSAGILSYNRGSLPFSREYQDIRITVRLKDEVSSGSKVCNVSKITSKNALSDTSDTVCVNIITPCKYDDTIQDSNDPNCAAPKVVCEVVDFAVNRTTRKVTYRTTATSTNPKNTTLKGYDYDFGDDTEVSFDTAEYQHETSHTYAPGEFETVVTVRYTTTGQTETTDQTYDCAAKVNFEEDQAVGQSKTVKNITKDVSGEIAAETSVGGNDVLEYTLTTTNSQNYERADITISDYIGDILDYATIDLAFLEEQGGTFDKETNKVIWDDVAIPANGEVLRSFRVKIKDPVPSTNSPSAMTTSFDCKISNVYGNEITINVDCPLVKGVETLPNTGPGTSLAAMTGVTVIIGYFFSRSRLLAKEVEYVRQDYAATGGM